VKRVSKSSEAGGMVDSSEAGEQRKRLEGPFSYAAWVGMCLDEFVKEGEASLTPERKRQLLEICPEDGLREGREFLDTLPEVAKALQSWQQESEQA